MRFLNYSIYIKERNRSNERPCTALRPPGSRAGACLDRGDCAGGRATTSPGAARVPTPTPIIPIPEPVEPLETDDAIQNILLLGADVHQPDATHRRDDRGVDQPPGRSVALWHVPRDLFVYIPGATVDRINLVYQIGSRDGGPDGAFQLLRETFLYNFGLPIDHYAMVNFTDFERIITLMGGLTISVDCALRDWRLIDPTLDPSQEENWELFTLPIGRRTLCRTWRCGTQPPAHQRLRSRAAADGRPACDVAAGARRGLFEQLTTLGPELLEIVETDMSLADLTGYVPLALSLEPSQIARYSGSPGVEYRPFLTPDDGRMVQLPVRDELLRLLRDFLTPPTENRLSRAAVSVEIVDASYLYAGFADVAADRLAWAGYAPRVVEGETPVRREGSVIYDYTASKGSPLEELLGFVANGRNAGHPPAGS